MGSILRYLGIMLPFMLLSVPVYLLIRAMILKRRKQHINRYHEIPLFLFTIYLCGLASQTILPRIEYGVNGLHILSGGVHTTNLVPFRVLANTAAEMRHGNTDSLLINLIGNIVLFVPVGFCCMLLWPMSKTKAILCGLGISLCIEICQLFLARGTDIDDLILNTLGAVIGVLLYTLLNKRLDNLFTSCKGVSS